jgi:hypothetical protein
MMRANTGATPHSLTAAITETDKPKQATPTSEPALSEAVSQAPEAQMDTLTGESPTDWIKDHVHDHAASSNVMRDRLIKIALGCVCIYAILQILAPMSDIMSITTLN